MEQSIVIHILVVIALVLVWKGIWDVADLYFPKTHEGASKSFFLGLFILVALKKTASMA
jgi:hypothetical protein